MVWVVMVVWVLGVCSGWCEWVLGGWVIAVVVVGVGVEVVLSVLGGVSV